MTLREKAARFLEKWSDTKELSWVGHGAQGLLFGFVGCLIGVGLAVLARSPDRLHAMWAMQGILYTHGAFSHREGDGALLVFLRDGWQAMLAHMVRDGWNDYASPMICAVVGWMLGLWLLGV